MPPSPPLLLVFDGNSLLHRAYHAAATGGLLDADERPVWALKGLVLWVARAAARLRPDAVIVGFDCPATSVRQDSYPEYKAQRAEKAPDLASQILDAPSLVAATGLAAVVHTGYEADDILASSAAQARDAGWRTVAVTSDRDAFALIDDVTSVLRVRNGGLDEAVLMTEATLHELYGVAPTQYRDFAALRGDPSDNLPGVSGFGSVLAGRLLGGFGTIEGAWEAGIAAVSALVGEVAGRNLFSEGAREAVERNRRLMRMHADLALPALDSARLPVPYLPMRRALADRGIILSQSLWALTGRPAPVEDQGPPPEPWARVWTRITARARREPSPDQIALF